MGLALSVNSLFELLSDNVVDVIGMRSLLVFYYYFGEENKVVVFFKNKHGINVYVPRRVAMH